MEQRTMKVARDTVWVQEVKAHIPISFTSVLMLIFHGKKHERENEKVVLDQVEPDGQN